MQGTVHRAAIRLAAILSLPWLVLAAGCGTTVDVAIDEREDLSRYRSWDFFFRGVPKVDAPELDERALDARVAGLIERELARRGFRRSSERPDFLVGYHLSLRRRAVIVEEPAAPYLLSSMNSSASYLIEGGSRKVRQMHEDLRLAIRVGGAESRRYAWRATLMQTLVNPSRLPLDDAVATLLDRLPGPGPLDAPGGSGAPHGGRQDARE